MRNPIDTLLKASNKLKLMTHVVAGYPDLTTSARLVQTMAEAGADLIEVQIPFSDPGADGPTIMEASGTALDQGVTPDDCLALVSDLSAKVATPLLLMSYINIPYRMGMDRFCLHAAAAGARGLIIPDIPFDQDHEDYYRAARSHKLYPIMVVSPGMAKKRLASIAGQAEGFLYATLKVGITGARRDIARDGLTFLRSLKTISPVPVAAGFGISSREQVKALEGIADIAVVGSHLINLFNQKGIKAVGEFVKECKA